VASAVAPPTRFAADGWNVAILDLDEAGAKTAADDIAGGAAWKRSA